MWLQNNAFILVTGNITVTAQNNTDAGFKNCAPFCTCTMKINNIFVDEANHIYITVLMYNLIEYSDNYSGTSEVYDSLKEMKFLLKIMI